MWNLQAILSQGEEKKKEERGSSSSEGSSFRSTATKVAAVAGAAAAAFAWAFASSNERQDPPVERPAGEMPTLPEDRGSLRRRDQTRVPSEYPKPNGRSRQFPGSNKTVMKVLSYNVWFREDLEVHERMKALGDLIQRHSPDLICFQEVTPYIYGIFRNSDWWKMYECSVSQGMAHARRYFCMLMSKLPVRSFGRKPFDNSTMGRELCVAEIDVGRNKKLIVATTHLESPSPSPPKWDQMYSKERVAQAKESIAILSSFPNVILGGDMNWDDELDGAFPLDDGWVDAWDVLRAGDNGWTYDTRSNPMLSGNRPLQKRLDRFVCKLTDLRIERIEMIGKEAVPGVSYCKEKRVRNQVKELVLPVLPSDHYGLLLTIRSH